MPRGKKFPACGYTNMYVCEKCIEDLCLQEVVRQNAISERCDYCDAVSETAIACELDDVMQRIRFAVDQEYGSPDEETAYDSEEGEYISPVYTGRELFDDIGFGLENRKLYDDIVGQFWDEAFCRIGVLTGSPHERQMDAWSGFKDIVKHGRRYTFLSMSDGDCDHGILEHPPSRMMQNIAKTLQHFDLIKKLGPEARFWRVRAHDEARILTIPIEIAAPTSEQAIYPNRMSPAGISMFYGSDFLETAWLETVEAPRLDGKVVTAGQFAAACPLNILDLCSLPTQKSFFRDWVQHTREALKFLHEFRDDLSQPVIKDGKQHIDYVPTQVFTEFVRYEFRTEVGERIHGIRYPSSKDGKPCYVIFADQDGCLDDVDYREQPQLLRYVDSSVRRLKSFDDI